MKLSINALPSRLGLVVQLCLLGLCLTFCSTSEATKSCHEIGGKLETGRSIDENYARVKEEIGECDSLYFWGGPITTNTIVYQYGDSLEVRFYTKDKRNEGLSLPGDTLSEETSQNLYSNAKVIGFLVRRYSVDSIECQHLEGTYHPANTYMSEP